MVQVLAAAEVETPEDLGVHRHELTRLADVEAPEAAWWPGEETREPVGVMAAQHAVHGARMQTEVRTQQIRTPTQLQAQSEDRRFERIWDATRRAMRSRAAIGIGAGARSPAICRTPGCAQ